MKRIQVEDGMSLSEFQRGHLQAEAFMHLLEGDL